MNAQRLPAAFSAPVGSGVALVEIDSAGKALVTSGSGREPVAVAAEPVAGGAVVVEVVV